MNLSDLDTKLLNELEGFLSITPSWAFTQFIHRPEKKIALFTGNQWGKNVNVAKHYVMRILGMHPIESKNMRPWKKIRTYRFCSETLPNDPEGGDRNTIYPVIKRLLPHSLIKKDITIRKPTMTIKDPQGGNDIYIEFVSYSQDVQTQAGVQRESIWIDENCNRQFYEEQLPRLIASDGDLIITMTPALGQITWQFEDIFEQASTIIRTPHVRERFNKRFKTSIQCIETSLQTNDICVIMCSTDDNPHYQTLVDAKNKREGTSITVSEYITGKLDLLDEDAEDVRRFGIFRQISGRIFKDFEPKTHIIDSNKFFEDGVPFDWNHARGIDYHEHVDWHVGFAALSPNDEMFIYDEVVASPSSNVTLEFAKLIQSKSKDYKYNLSLIDPLASKKQVNTGLSTIDDLNRIFHEFKRESQGTGGYWAGWDTKSTRGREEIRKRLKNARLCGTPFNNTSVKDGIKQNLPTLWILSNCRHTIEAMKNWRLEEWQNRSAMETHEIKETPQQKWSHMNMVWEAICKHPAFRPKSSTYQNGYKERGTYVHHMRGV